MKKSKHKCSECKKYKVIVMQSGYGSLCRECSSNSEVKRKYKIFRPSDLCACGHTSAEHRDEDEPETALAASPPGSRLQGRGLWMQPV
jgi:hypothetical protein